MILTQLLAAATIAGPGSLGEIWQHIVADFSNLGDPAALATFGSVLMIDLVLAGDNAIVVGALAAGLPAVQRRKVIFIGIGAALVLRIVFALLVSWLTSGRTFSVMRPPAPTVATNARLTPKR